MSFNRDFLGRGWAFPFGFDAATGGLKTSSAEENIRQNITIILGTRPGERQMLPSFGCRIHELLFAPNEQSTAHRARMHVEEALAQWEPRIKVEKVSAMADPTGALHIDVEYKIKSLGTTHALTQVVSPTQRP